jgi:hypothetical protein
MRKEKKEKRKEKREKRRKQPGWILRCYLCASNTFVLILTTLTQAATAGRIRVSKCKCLGNTASLQTTLCVVGALTLKCVRVPWSPNWQQQHETNHAKGNIIDMYMGMLKREKKRCCA